MTQRLIVLAGLLLAGCAADSQQPSVSLSGVLPAECVQRDPRWQPLPERDVTRSELARNYAANKAHYRALLRARAVCRAGATAAS